MEEIETQIQYVIIIINTPAPKHMMFVKQGKFATC